MSCLDKCSDIYEEQAIAVGKELMKNLRRNDDELFGCIEKCDNVVSCIVKCIEDFYETDLSDETLTNESQNQAALYTVSKRNLSKFFSKLGKWMPWKP